MESDDWDTSERSAGLRQTDHHHLEEALFEARRWIEKVTTRKFASDSFRKSMTDGILLCMLMQAIKPGVIKKINRSRSIYAGVDNLNVFLNACEELGLKAAQLFHPGDLQDLSSRASLSIADRRREEERRLKSVCITIFWLGRNAKQLDSYVGPQLCLEAFAPLVHGSSSLVKGLSPDNASSGVSSWASGTSANNRHSSQGYHDDDDDEERVFSPSGLDLTAVAPETYAEPRWKRELRRELDSAVPGLSDLTSSHNSSSGGGSSSRGGSNSNTTTATKPVLRMEGSRRRQPPPPVAAKPSLHARSRSMPERSALERQGSVEDEDAQSCRSGSSAGDPLSPSTYDEFVRSKGMMEDDQEVWMSSLDSWKSRRRRVTSSALERKASREEVEQTDQSRQRRRSKTYQEMMEEKEKREKILLKMATKNKTLEAEDIVHILTKPALYEDEIRDVPERRARSKSIPGNFKQGEAPSSPLWGTAGAPYDSADAPRADAPLPSRRAPPSVLPKPKVRRSGVGSAFAPYQRADDRASSGSRQQAATAKAALGQRMDDYAGLRPGLVEPLTFREKLLRDREREIGLAAGRRESADSARRPQKKRLSLGIMGRVAAFNRGEGDEEGQPKPPPTAVASAPAPKPAPKLEPEYTELSINMKQRPRNEAGFGFTIVGGADAGRSIVVTSITPGSTAVKSGLKVGDEIVAIDGERTKLVTYDHAMYCFNSATITGELSLLVHRYEDLTLRRPTNKAAERPRSMGEPKRRAVSQPSAPGGMSQAARARKILEQMREEEQRLDEQRRQEKEEEVAAALRSRVNGNQSWEPTGVHPEPLRSYYNDPECPEESLGDSNPPGPPTLSLSEPRVPAPPVADAKIKPKAEEVKPVKPTDYSSKLDQYSPNEEQYGKQVQVGVEILRNDESPDRGSASPNPGSISPNRGSTSPNQGIVSPEPEVVLGVKENAVENYPDQAIYGPGVEVEVEVMDSAEGITKSQVEPEQSLNLLAMLGQGSLEVPRSVSQTKEGVGPDGGVGEGSPGSRSSRRQEVVSDGEMFSSEEDERIEAEIMDRLQEEQRREEEEEERHRRIEQDEQNKSSIQEEPIVPQSKEPEESPITPAYQASVENDPSAQPLSQSQPSLEPPTTPSTATAPSTGYLTTLDGGKPKKFQPVKFNTGPKPFNRLGPEPFKPGSFRPVSLQREDNKDGSGNEAKAPDAKAPDAKAPDAKVSEAKVPEAKVPEAKVPEIKAPEAKLDNTKLDNAKPDSRPQTKPDLKQDMLKRRTDFFSKPPEPSSLPVFGYSDDEKERNDRSGASSPAMAVRTSSPAEPIVEPQSQKTVEGPAPVTAENLSAKPGGVRKAFNLEEEKRRLERWHAEQERIRQEQYEQEQVRLQEQRAKDLERAESEERQRKADEHQRLLAKQRSLWEQAGHERERLEEERKARRRQEMEYLEQARLEREAAEQERLRDEEEHQVLVAERRQKEEERRLAKEEEARRLAAEEEEERRLTEEEEARRLKAAEARRQEIDRLREEEARALRRKEEEEEALASREAEEALLRQKEAAEAERRRLMKEEAEADRQRLARLREEEAERQRLVRLREEEIERIRLEEREKLRQEWEDLQRERAQQEARERAELERLEELRAEQERLRQERLRLERQQEEERRQLQRERERLLAQLPERIPSELQDKPLPSNAQPAIKKESPVPDKVVEEVVVSSQSAKDVHSAPPPTKSEDDSYKVPGQAYLSKYKDGRMATQHWLIEEAERRRLAEKSGQSRPLDPVEVQTGPVPRKDLDLEPVLEKRSAVAENAAPTRRLDKPAAKDPKEVAATEKKEEEGSGDGDRTYREVAVDVPKDFQAPVPRRARGMADKEAERRRKAPAETRQSAPAVGGGRAPDVIRNEAPPVPKERSNGRMPENLHQQPQLGPPGRSSAFQQPNKKPAPGRSVSGKVTCSNCSKSLGRGAAMIIESLGLHFHIECFRCCVCNIQLGNGTKGTDVRIRASKLHCQNCYSNDAGFEFTEV